MAIEIKLPKMSENADEALIEEWQKKVGDHIEKGDVLVKVEVDKAMVDIEAEHSGYLLEIRANTGDTARWGDTIAVVGDKS